MGLLEAYFSPSTNSALIVTCILLFIYYFLQAKYSYWSNKGVPCIPTIKCIIHTFQTTLQLKPIFEVLQEQYAGLAGEKYGGAYFFTSPNIMLRDPESVRTWLIKGFSSFHDRGPKPDEESDGLSSNLFQLTGEKWHQVRHKVSPAFSSAKLKMMYQTLKECSDDLNSHLLDLCSKSGETELNIKDLMSNFTMDVIGACAMGIKCNAIKDPNCELKQIVDKSTRFGLRRTICMVLELIHPKLPGLCGVKAHDPEVEGFLRTLCKDATLMKSNAGSSNRKDFLQILINIRSSEVDKMNEPIAQSVSGSLEKVTSEVESLEDSEEGPIFTENVMVGIISSFLSAGYEPVASTLTFCLYELAQHPEIQEKIMKEIETVVKKNYTDISYEDLKKCTYTDQVINETLRKHPVTYFMIRNCVEPFIIPDTTAVVDKNVTLIIPVYSIQHDPKYFPEPDRFDPERFSKENIDKIVPGSYLPFGEGPRFCIAMRLATMEVKALVLTMVSNFTLHTCAKTQTPLKYDNSFLSLSPMNIWLRLKKRK